MTAIDTRSSAVLSREQRERTGAFIAARQRPDGGLPWFPGSHLDPWDHIESAMGLSSCGLWEQAVRAYRFSAESQRADGTWPMVLREDVVEDAGADTNQTAYVAVGVWHHTLVTGDMRFLRQMWPTVRRALDFVVRMQRPDGAFAWAVDPAGRADAGTALLTGTASTAQALAAGCAIGGVLGHRTPAWRAAAGRAAHAVAAHPEAFADRSRYSMDWYYPVLAGAMRGQAGHRRLAEGWDRFVVPGWGARCVSDRPWVTAAESSELVLALDSLGNRVAAARLLTDIQHLRHEDGGYWTGFVVADDAVWPEERTTWTAAAVLLADDALGRLTPGARVFGDALCLLCEVGDTTVPCCGESGLPGHPAGTPRHDPRVSLS